MSIFFNEWRNCLREHYRYVLRTEDWITEKTLREVLLGVGGFSEDELQALYEEIFGPAAPTQEEILPPDEVEVVIPQEEFTVDEPPLEEEPPPQEEDKPPSFIQGRLF